jgi:DNA modification methylase
VINAVMQGDCRDVMRLLVADGVRVQCVVTSPPYWGLRDYGVPGQLGLESTPDEYVANMVEVFRLVRELLADDGVLWLNLGDSYARQAGDDSTKATDIGMKTGRTGKSDKLFKSGNNAPPLGLKAKDLVGIPWRTAFALQADGWWLRQDIIWSKPNPMPESVTDRCTKAHEYLFLLAKSERYFYDAEAIKEAFADERMGNPGKYAARLKDHVTPMGAHGNGVTGSGWNAEGDAAGRNRRSVWTIATQPYAEAHFATFPEKLVEPCVLAGSRPGDVVFDQFMGSGTVASVAQRLGRQWLGAELNPAYIVLANNRASGTIGMAL